MTKKIIYLFLLSVIISLFAAFPALAAEMELSVSLESGFYSDPLQLEIVCSNREAVIYYTLDGSEPGVHSLVYNNGIYLSNSEEREDTLIHNPSATHLENYIPEMDFPTGHVVRAVAILPNGDRSDIFNGTYFIGYDRKKLYGDTSVMFLVTDPENLFDYEKGIYVLGKAFDEWKEQQGESFEKWEVEGNFSMRGSDWERPVSVTYSPANGRGFMQDMGLRIKGNVTRANSQKSLRMIARKEYGNKNVKYPLFPENICEYEGGIVNKYKSFTLRSGGNDCNYTKIRDAYMSTLTQGMNFETADSMPCIAFINGEYWGVYSLIEEFSKNYFQYHYGMDDNEIVIIKNGKLEDGEEEDISLFHEMYDYITSYDMSVDENYIQASEILDMQSFIDYCAVHLYIVNEDGPLGNHNWQMWRCRTEQTDIHPYGDGKWRTILFDTDYSSGIFSAGENAGEDNITAVLEKSDNDWRNFPDLFYALVQNGDFRKELIRACCDVRNLYFDPDRMSMELEEIKNAYLPYIPDSWRRFGPESIIKDPESRINKRIAEMMRFFDERHSSFTDIMKNALNTDDLYTVSVSLSDPARGSIYFNKRDIPVVQGLDYQYVKNIELVITAKPLPGAKFVRWDIFAGSELISSSEHETITLIPAKSITVRAVFE